MSRKRNQQDRLFQSQESSGDVTEDLSEDGKRIVSAIREDMAKLKAEFLDQLNIKTKVIEDLSNEIEILKAKVIKLEEKVEDSEAYERRDTLVISGKNVPPVTPGESCVSIVCSLLRSQLNLNVQPTDLSTAHRLGKKPTNQQLDTRRIIMKLCRRDIKGDILKACRQLKPNIFINESLTPARNTIMYVLRRAKRKPNSRVTGCSSSGGRVFAYVKSTDAAHQDTRDRRIPVNTYSELEAFCKDVLNEPLANYVDRWPH